MYWTRVEGLALALFYCLVLTIQWLKKKEWKIGRQLVVVILILGVGILPYVGFLRWQTGTWTVSRYVSNITAHTAAQPERILPHQVDNPTTSLSYAFQGLLRHPLGLVQKVVRNGNRLLLIWLPELIGPIFLAPCWLALFLMGIYSWWKQQWFGKMGWLLGTVLVSFLVVAMHGGNPRYLMPLLPFLLLAIGQGISDLPNFCIRKKNYLSPSPFGPCAGMEMSGDLRSKFCWGSGGEVSLAVGVVLVILLGTFSLEPLIRELIGKVSTFPIEYREAGLALQAQYDSNYAVMSRKPQVGYYAGLTTVTPSEWNREGIEQSLPSTDCKTLLVVDERETLSLYPDLEYLMKSPAPKGWRTIYRREQSPQLVVLQRGGER
jgi:hypothetical protein